MDIFGLYFHFYRIYLDFISNIIYFSLYLKKNEDVYPEKHS